MPLYTIVLTGPDSGSWAKVKEHWPEDHFIQDDRQAFIVSNDLTDDIAKKIGLVPDAGVSGLVVQMDY